MAKKIIDLDALSEFKDQCDLAYGGGSAVSNGRLIKITTSPSSYTTVTGGFKPSYRVARSAFTVNTTNISDPQIGDFVYYSYYYYYIGYVDASYVYLSARVDIRGPQGPQGPQGPAGSGGATYIELIASGAPLYISSINDPQATGVSYVGDLLTQLTSGAIIRLKAPINGSNAYFELNDAYKDSDDLYHFVFGQYELYVQYLSNTLIGTTVDALSPSGGSEECSCCSIQASNGQWQSVSSSYQLIPYSEALSAIVTPTSFGQATTVTVYFDAYGIEDGLSYMPYASFAAWLKSVEPSSGDSFILYAYAAQGSSIYRLYMQCHHEDSAHFMVDSVSLQQVQYFGQR